MSASRNKISNVDKKLLKAKCDIHASAFGLLFSEIVQYCQNRVSTIPDLHTKLSEMGFHVGQRILDVLFVREKNYRRETKIIQLLVFIQNNVWKALFGKEADKLEQANNDERVYYIIENEALVNKFISVPKDRSNLNCAAFVAGIVEAIIVGSNFPAKVTAHWHQGTTYMIKFEEAALARDRSISGR